MSIDLQTTVGELVVEKPSRARLFESLGIDYCCGGRKPLAEACREKNLDPETVARVLDVADEPRSSEFVPDIDFRRMSLTELADHIEIAHHAWLKRELPRIQYLIRRVVNAHGHRHTYLPKLLETFLAFEREMMQHMAKEEQVLFPMVRELDAADEPLRFHCGSLNNPIHVMEHEHDQAGAALERMRALTNGFTPPADACNTFRVMLDALRQVEEDTHQHIHKENNILFPRALEREAQMNSQMGASA